MTGQDRALAFVPGSGLIQVTQVHKGQQICLKTAQERRALERDTGLHIRVNSRVGFVCESLMEAPGLLPKYTLKPFSH